MTRLGRFLCALGLHDFTPWEEIRGYVDLSRRECRRAKCLKVEFDGCL